MAAENPALAIQADSHSAEVLRRAIASLLGGVTGGTPGGIVAPTDLAVTAGSGNSLNVAAGEVWIPGTSQAHMGAYYGYNDAVVNLGVTPNASNPLYAIVTASVNDQAYTGNPGVANDTWNLLLTQGTAAPSPTVPATPANSLLLATVLVPAAAASSAAYTITDNRSLLSIGNYLDLRGNPAGRLYASAQTILSSSVTAGQITLATDFVVGGVTVSSSGLVVPVAGKYLVSAAVQWQSGGNPIAAGSLITQVRKNGTAVREWQSYNGGTSVAGPSGTDVITCAASDVLTLYAAQVSGANAGTRIRAGALDYTFLSAELVSI